MSAAIQNYWVAFAKTGDPGKAGGPAWPKYDLATEAGDGFRLGWAGRPHASHRYALRLGEGSPRADQRDGRSRHRTVDELNPAHEGPRQWVIPGNKSAAAH